MKFRKKPIVKFYSLSVDEKGLVAYCEGRKSGFFTYHIHSDELTDLEKWILGLLKDKALKKQ